MSTNPLFDDTVPPADPQAPDSYVLAKKEHKIEPLTIEADRDAATAVIRQKLDKIYANEPDAAAEIEEVKLAVNKPPSKHQQFMHALSTSGKSLAEIQTEWHHYYVTLPDNEKHQVWQEFYDSNSTSSSYHQQAPKPSITLPQLLEEKGIVTSPEPTLLAVHPAPKKQPAKRSPAAIKQTIVKHVTADGKLKAKHHFQSLLFGLGMGAVVIFIFLFGFFNEFFIAPFIQPSRHASATPLILNADSVAPTTNPEVIIPKINVEIPVDYTQTSTDENVIENALQSGIVHYPTTVLPGQNGNTAFFGHSSNNIFNKGKYKFAFVLLHTLVPGDTFYLTNNGKVYVYKVITKDIVDPSDVGVLGPVAGQTAIATLITCDPPGTSLHRLIIVGQQISPDPASNTQSTTNPVAAAAAPSQQLPGNGPTLFGRFWHWLF